MNEKNLTPWPKGISGNPGGQTKRQRALRQAWSLYLQSDFVPDTGEGVKRLDEIFRLLDDALFVKKEKWALDFALNHIIPRSVEFFDDKEEIKTQRVKFIVEVVNAKTLEAERLEAEKEKALRRGKK